MFNIFANSDSAKDIVTFAQVKPVLAGLVLIIIGLLVIVIYLVNTWQPKSFTEKQKAAAKKTTAKKTKK